MGTHSLIIMRVKDNSNKYTIYSVLYQQFDGDLSYVGKKLCSFLKRITITNGIEIKLVNGKIVREDNIANGPGCLFAQIIKLFKTETGGAYICEPSDNDLEEYNYYVDVIENQCRITLMNNDNVLFRGNASDALTYISQIDQTSQISQTANDE